MKVGIIGCGASGLVAAIKAKNKNNEVIILEKNKELAKKLLATGNGKCNYWNEDQSLIHYQSSKQENIKKIINEETEKMVKDFFDDLGILSKIKNGYYYPFSNQASTIRNALVDCAKSKGVVIKSDYKVRNVILKDKKIIVNNELTFDILLLATGSYASLKQIDEYNGYNFLRLLNHDIINVLPSLVQLVTDAKFLKKWKGIRTDVVLTHLEDNKEIRKEKGEIQLTDYGISGICTFNLSNQIARGLYKKKKEYVVIDFLPILSKEELEKILSNSKEIVKNLNNLLNSKLVEVILNEINISNECFNDLNRNMQIELINKIKAFKIKIYSVKGYEFAQCCSGGVNLDEINLKTMESKKVPNLYVTGELLDLTGDCGGYNLGIAWRSGLLAGNAIGSRSKDD